MSVITEVLVAGEMRRIREIRKILLPHAPFPNAPFPIPLRLSGHSTPMEPVLGELRLQMNLGRFPFFDYQGKLFS
jgi:hypothetical protein